MNRHPQRPDAEEEALLEHFRRHSDAQPSAQLDARILAAARAAVPQHPSAWQRVRQWLFGSPQRWSVALAGLATLGIGLNLTLRTYEQAPPRFDAPAPAAAPSMQRQAMPQTPALYSAPAASAPQTEERKVLAESASVQDLAAPAAKRKAEAAEPETDLRRLLELQRQGDAAAAQQLRTSLRQRYPQLDIDKELKRLQAQPE
ncbi:hypothetical protein ACOXVJ_00895 [Pseudomonas knackmussii]|uniref:hypothetical protein n=1 Tax=Pseudomonas knackmussii TaxID=65741 RepID=UPI003BC1E8CD